MLQDVIEGYVLSCFSEGNKQEMAGINNIKLDTLIFCTNKKKLDKYVDDLLHDFDVEDSIDKIIRTKNRVEIRFKDGRKILSTGYSETARGFRYKKLILDLEEMGCSNIFDHIIVPMGYACKRSDVSFI